MGRRTPRSRCIQSEVIDSPSLGFTLSDFPSWISVPRVISSASAHKHNQQYFRRLVYQAENSPADYSLDSDHRLDTLTIEVPQVPASQTPVSDNETNEIPSQLDHVSFFASTEKHLDILIPTRQVIEIMVNVATHLP